ncbi:MAG TPA: 3-oxoacyl-ACP reductase FabG [Bryobacteraceae bacterium]|nr:3-oxoacyl-ACP reductase FabG [Bryobacteraceae bacterium]
MSVALVTGGSRGIGRAIVEEFRAAGHKVAFTYNSNEAAAAELVHQLGAEHVLALQADVRHFGRAAEVIAETIAKFGPITALINNAGIKKDLPLMKMDADSWRDVIDTNLNGVFNYSRNSIGAMLRTGGAIVNVTSVSGVIGMAGQTNYSASKAGVIGFTKALAKEVARFGVRVNAVAPGFIDTDMTSAIDEATRKKLYAAIPSGQPGSAADVAKLVLHLASDAGKYVTGQVWNIDGGLT